MSRFALTVVVLLATGALTGSAAAQGPSYPPPTTTTQPSQQPQQVALPAMTIREQTDGVNSLRVVTVAAFCRGPAACTGKAKLTKGGQTLASAPFTAAGKTTFKTPMKLKASVFRALHAAKGKRMKPKLTLTLADGTSFSRVITIKL